MKKKMTFNQKLGLGFLVAAPFVLATCDNGTKPETENPGTVIPTPVEKIHLIELTNLDGESLKFNVKYMALPDATPPAYLEYLKELFVSIAGNGGAPNAQAVRNLINNGGIFTILVESSETSFDGLLWDSANRVFKLHNDWISNASDLDLSLAMMRNAFNSVTPVENAMLKDFTLETHNDRHSFCLVSLVTV